MYKIYFDGVQLPVAPPSMDTKINGNNKTINLINEAEVNLIKGSKLTEYSFDFLLPNSEYPFAEYAGGSFQEAQYYLNKLEKLKALKKPFEFIVLKIKGDAIFQEIQTYVTLEDYTVKDDAGEHGFDNYVSVNLKAYKDFGTTRIKVKAKNNKVTYTKIKISTTKKKIPTTYTTKKGDTLFLISKKVYGKYTANNAKAIFSKNKEKKKFKNTVLAFLSEIRGKTVKKIKGNGTKRIYTKMVLPKGIKLTIPQNKK